MTMQTITVKASVAAPIEKVWLAYTTPADIMQWNAVSDDWHATAATVNLSKAGIFFSRMEAKDGSMGFDFAGTYTRIEPLRLIEYSFGGRSAGVEFTPVQDGTLISLAFVAEAENPIEQQRSGWQAILDNFARHAGSR